jgi:2'-5' RNA ligase
MNYTITIFSKFKGLDKIDSIRKKYDSKYDWIETHIALVYYFKEKPDLEKINEIISGFSSFEIGLGDVRVSSDSKYLFLDVVRGREKVVELKDKLYEGLGLEWDKDFLYEPHITLGKIKDEEEMKRIFGELKAEGFDFSCKVDSFSLLEVSEDLGEIMSRKRFRLEVPETQ